MLILLTIAIVSSTLSVGVQPGNCGDGLRHGFRLSAQWFIDHSNELWSLKVDGQRSAHLITVDGERQFAVPGTAMAALRKVATEQDFWSLPSTYGEPSQTGFQRLELCDGGRSKVVTVYGLQSSDSLTDHERRFLTIWVATRRLFVSKAAADVDYAEALLRKPETHRRE